MIRKEIEQWLTAVFRLPVVEEFNQEKVEQAIGYDLSASEIKIR